MVTAVLPHICVRLAVVWPGMSYFGFAAGLTKHHTGSQRTTPSTSTGLSVQLLMSLYDAKPRSIVKGVPGYEDRVAIAILQKYNCSVGRHVATSYSWRWDLWVSVGRLDVNVGTSTTMRTCCLFHGAAQSGRWHVHIGVDRRRSHG